MDRLHVATLNILNLAERWWERLPLILSDMAALQPDLLALQEVVYVMGQDRLIGAAGDGTYTAVRGWAGRPEYGNSLLVRAPLVAADVDRIDLGLRLQLEILEEAPPHLKPGYAFAAEQPVEVKKVIAVFGRHPHRNAALGRASTPPEQAYIAEGRFPHLRVPPAAS